METRTLLCPGVCVETRTPREASVEARTLQVICVIMLPANKTTEKVLVILLSANKPIMNS